MKPHGEPVLDDARWEPWTPLEIAQKLRQTQARWYVVAGWAVDLFLGRQTRLHEDIEIATPRDDFHLVRAALPEIDFYVVGDGHRYPLDPPNMEEHFQTWGWDPDRSAYVVDIFRDPCDGDEWICRRDLSIRRTFGEVIRRDANGIPFLAPEVVMLFKAKHVRDKDRADWALVHPLLDEQQRAWLIGALDLVHPEHPWTNDLRARVQP